MDDAQIVQLYWNRDERAIPATAEKYGAYCEKIARSIVGNREDAEECVNDTYLNAWNAIPPHRPSALSTFLGKITRNAAFNKFKHNTADKRGGGELPAILDELAECVSGKEDVEQKIDGKELAKVVDSFLKSLPRDKRNVFVRRYWYSDGIPDIARRYGMKESAVSVTLSRLRLKLRDYLSERGYDV